MPLTLRFAFLPFFTTAFGRRVFARNGNLAASSESASLPDLGRFAKDFQIEGWLATGGQAAVYYGQDLRGGVLFQQRKPVVFRFLKGLCDHNSTYCRVEELESMNPMVLSESRVACGLANAANERWEKFNSTVQTQRRSPFNQCVQAVSDRSEDPAFEVWERAIGYSMDLFFFTERGGRDIAIDEKRRVLRYLRKAIRVLGGSSYAEDAEHPCCCPKQDASQLDGAARMNYQCTTTPAYSMFLRTECQPDWERVPGACGPIAHNDIKFENVMVGFKGDGSPAMPTIVDFGSASRCADEQEQMKTTEDWLPAWSDDGQQNKRSRSMGCWSYDLYGLGLAWLVTEILKNMPSHYLGCFAASSLGLSQSDCKNWYIMYDYMATSKGDGQDVLLRPVRNLIGELHKFLRPEMLESADIFVKAITRFVGKDYRSHLAEDVGKMPLTMPLELILKRDIFPLLQECPSIPDERDLPLSPSPLTQPPSTYDKVAVLECRVSATVRDVNAAIAASSTDTAAEGKKKLRQLCDELGRITVELDHSHMPHSWRSMCEV